MINTKEGVFICWCMAVMGVVNVYYAYTGVFNTHQPTVAYYSSLVGQLAILAYLGRLLVKGGTPLDKGS